MKIPSVGSSGLIFSLSRTNGVAPGKVPVRGVAPDVILNMPGVAEPAAPPGVRNGVESSVFGVATPSLLGVAPLKSGLTSGALAPPINGVSTCVRAIKFCASCKILSIAGAGVRGVRNPPL